MQSHVSRVIYAAPEFSRARRSSKKSQAFRGTLGKMGSRSSLTESCAPLLTVVLSAALRLRQLLAIPQRSKDSSPSFPRQTHSQETLQQFDFPSGKAECHRCTPARRMTAAQSPATVVLCGSCMTLLGRPCTTIAPPLATGYLNCIDTLGLKYTNRISAHCAETGPRPN